MTRAILVALGTGTIITSAAAFGIGAAREVPPQVIAHPESQAEFARLEQGAREGQRALIEARYVLAKERCVPLRGYDHDQCLIDAHAVRGRALLESQGPYVVRPG
jgi:hypothetical protein